MTSHPSLNIKIQSLNVKGLGKSIKRRSIFRWLHNQKHQFAFLQETHSTKECAQFWEAEWGRKVFFSHGSSNSKGVMETLGRAVCYCQKFLAPPNMILSRLVFIEVKTSKVLILIDQELFYFCICAFRKWNPLVSNPAIHKSCEFMIWDTPQETKGKITPVLL